MSVNLKKGEKINLSKDRPGLSKVFVGLGWKAAHRGIFSFFRSEIDCDSSIFLLKDGRLQNNADMVWYKNLTHYSGAIKHCGDNLIGSSGKNDDEQIMVDLTRIPTSYDKLIVVVNIYEAYSRRQHFGMIKKAYARVIDEHNGEELCSFELAENYSGSTAIIVGKLCKVDGNWEFKAVGEGTRDGSIAALAARYR